MASSPPASSLLDNDAESPLLITANGCRISEPVIPDGLLPAHLAAVFGELSNSSRKQLLLLIGLEPICPLKIA